jgi:hypothetical protein
VHGTNGIGHYAILDINLTAPIRTTQLAISKWLNLPSTSKMGKASTSNQKRVVHISSIAGQCPSFAVPMYIASKHGELDISNMSVNTTDARPQQELVALSALSHLWNPRLEFA